MSNISVTDARGLFTKMLIAVYRERVTPTSFLRSFFPVKESSTKELAIEVQRGTEKIAVDVERGTEGNRNSFSRSTEKIFVPPYYREYFDATELDLYDRLFGSTSEIDSDTFQSFLEAVADKLRMLQDKIERAYELQCAQVLETGIVTLEAGVNIDFKRKSASLKDNTATPWTGSYDPYLQYEAGGDFLRQVGKSEGSVINAIHGSLAMRALLANTFVKERGPLTNINLDAIRAPQKNSVGASLFGRITAGSYSVNLWTYPEFYDNASGVSTPYINPKKVIMLPEAPKFVLGFAAVPQLLTTGIAAKKGAYLIGNYVDERNSKHIFDIKSAGVAIPVGVDQIYTMQVIS